MAVAVRAGVAVATAGGTVVAVGRAGTSVAKGVLVGFAVGELVTVGVGGGVDALMRPATIKLEIPST